MKIVVDGVTYEDSTGTRPGNKTVMAFEAAMGCTFAAWGIHIREMYREIGERVAEVRAATPEGEEPDLSWIDQTLPMRDLTALVFLARRLAGESNLRFDDVEFTEITFVAEDDDDLGDGSPEPEVDANEDPTAGSSGTGLEPRAPISTPTG